MFSVVNVLPGVYFSSQALVGWRMLFCEITRLIHFNPFSDCSHLETTYGQ